MAYTTRSHPKSLLVPSHPEGGTRGDFGGGSGNKPGGGLGGRGRGGRGGRGGKGGFWQQKMVKGKGKLGSERTGNQIVLVIERVVGMLSKIKVSNARKIILDKIDICYV
jgi:hypothetical protein